MAMVWMQDKEGQAGSLAFTASTGLTDPNSGRIITRDVNISYKQGVFQVADHELEIVLAIGCNGRNACREAIRTQGNAGGGKFRVLRSDGVTQKQEKSFTVRRS